jgi:predicted ATP-dependent endonuclease of OLD family
VNTLEYAKKNGGIYVKITNFRSIKEVELILSGSKKGNITQLIGRNNSGKTNIMLAIYKALEFESAKEGALSIDDRQDEKKDIIVEFFYKGEEYKAVAKPKKPKFSWETEVLPFEVVYLKAFPDTEDAVSSVRTKAFGKLIERYTKIINKDEEIQKQIGLLKDIIKSTDEKLLSGIIDGVSRTAHGCDKNLRELLYKPTEIVPSDLLKKRVLNVLYGDKSNLLKFPWEKMGHGTQRLILLSIYLEIAKQKTKVDSEENDEKEVLLLVEEPEIFMHPQQQKAVSKLIADRFSKPESNIKVVVSTHSPYFIDHQRLHQLRIVRKVTNSTKVHRDGKPTLFDQKDMPVTNKDSLVNIILKCFRIEPHTKEIFFAEKVLLVEGDNEALTIPYLLDSIYDHNMDQKGITTLNSHGNQELISHAELLISFGIPFIIAMDLDGNKDDTIEKYNALKKLIENSSLSGIRIITIATDYCFEMEFKTSKDTKDKPKKDSDFSILEKTFRYADRIDEIPEIVNKYFIGIIDGLNRIGISK